MAVPLVQVNLAPQPPAPGPGLASATAPAVLAAPVAGVASILNAVAIFNQSLEKSLELRFDGLELKFDGLEQRLDGLLRDTVISGNIAKGSGLTLPYSEVLFLDGTKPTIAVTAVPA
ncbi:hypothetical protein B0H12DRAFT_1325433 [Mycena haematopus]|nr:hypothetical protein B0H12DRAFT_1325433 [Mycena haematopus]